MIEEANRKRGGDVDEPPDAFDLLRELRAENERLRARIQELEMWPASPVLERAFAGSVGPPDDEISAKSSTDAKLALYQDLFRGREDVFATRWESPDGRSGYAPALRWGAPRGRRIKHPAADYLPLTADGIRSHLTGAQTVGIYPLLPDETCSLLAIDFDKKDWQKDVLAVLGACDSLGVPAALERSRSGQGAHLWVFFAAPVRASQARNLGSAILTRALDHRYQIGLDSYDRLFPSQDTLPTGGFGNLIALPLQGMSRRAGNTVFLDQRVDWLGRGGPQIEQIRPDPGDQGGMIVQSGADRPRQPIVPFRPSLPSRSIAAKSPFFRGM